MTLLEVIVEITLKQKRRILFAEGFGGFRVAIYDHSTERISHVEHVIPEVTEMLSPELMFPVIINDLNEKLNKLTETKITDPKPYH